MSLSRQHSLPRATCGWNRTGVCSAGGLTPSISHHSESHFVDFCSIFLDLLGQPLQFCDVGPLSLRLEIMISHPFNSSATSKHPDLLSMRTRPTRHQTKYRTAPSILEIWKRCKVQSKWPSNLCCIQNSSNPNIKDHQVQWHVNQTIPKTFVVPRWSPPPLAWWSPRPRATLDHAKNPPLRGQRALKRRNVVPWPGANCRAAAGQSWTLSKTRKFHLATPWKTGWGQGKIRFKNCHAMQVSLRITCLWDTYCEQTERSFSRGFLSWRVWPPNRCLAPSTLRQAPL